MLNIDGSLGEGGGQILRTSLALSLVTGIPFHIHHIRAGRPRPGLGRQHLAALNAAARLSSARVQGNAAGSQTVTFVPQAVRSGRYHYTVGSAGSCTLVLQTLLPALARADGPSELVLEGGTHNPFAPPFDFLEKAFAPLINRMGPDLSVQLERPGFYPAGGGMFRAQIFPARQWRSLELIERGTIAKQSARALVSRLPLSIAQRELRVVAEMLRWDGAALSATAVENAPGPGNVLMLEIASKDLTEVFTGFGQRGVPAEIVAERAVTMAQEYLKSGVPVGRHLADQLLIPLALAGCGAFVTLAPTRHTTTNIAVIQQFLDVHIELSPLDDVRWRVEVHG